MMFGTGVGLMVALLVVTLLVVPVSFGVAARADQRRASSNGYEVKVAIRFRAKVRRLAESRASHPNPVARSPSRMWTSGAIGGGSWRRGRG